MMIPCPFCSGEAGLFDQESGTGRLPKTAREPRCRKCGCSIGYFDTKELAIAAWNRRTPPKVGSEELDAAGRSVLQEIWDDATNSVCQTMQERKMCNCPDGDCLAAKVNPGPADFARLDALAAPVDHPEVVGERTAAWLIERNNGEQPWTWYAENSTGWHWWTTVAHEAKQFPSKAVAEAHPAYQMIASDPAIGVTEHVFLGEMDAPASKIFALPLRLGQGTESEASIFDRNGNLVCQCVDDDCQEKALAFIRAVNSPITVLELEAAVRVLKMSLKHERELVERLKLCAALQPSDSRALEAGVAVTDAMVEAAIAAYAKSTDTMEEHLETHKFWLRPAINAALVAALAIPAKEDGK